MRWGRWSGKRRDRDRHLWVSVPIQLIAAAMASLTYCILALVLLPKTVTDVTITRNTSEAIRPYSMAVAPDSSRQNRVR